MLPCTLCSCAYSPHRYYFKALDEKCRCISVLMFGYLTYRSHKHKTCNMLITLPCFDFVIRRLQGERKILVRLKVAK